MQEYRQNPFKSSTLNETEFKKCGKSNKKCYNQAFYQSRTISLQSLIFPSKSSRDHHEVFLRGRFRKFIND